MKRQIAILPIFVVCGLLFTACSFPIPVKNANESSAASESIMVDSLPASSTAANLMTTSSASNYSGVQEMAQKVKDYILNGQNDKPDAQKLKWSEAFLIQVDFKTVYPAYLSAGGKADDVQSFAQYLSQNAPVPGNWKELFEADLMKEYNKKASRYELIQDNLYQVYVQDNGSEVRYVVVNARTGYFHG